MLRVAASARAGPGPRLPGQCCPAQPPAPLWRGQLGGRPGAPSQPAVAKSQQMLKVAQRLAVRSAARPLLSLAPAAWPGAPGPLHAQRSSPLAPAEAKLAARNMAVASLHGELTKQQRQTTLAAFRRGKHTRFPEQWRAKWEQPNEAPPGTFLLAGPLRSAPCLLACVLSGVRTVRCRGATHQGGGGAGVDSQLGLAGALPARPATPARAQAPAQGGTRNLNPQPPLTHPHPTLPSFPFLHPKPSKPSILETPTPQPRPRPLQATTGR